MASKADEPILIAALPRSGSSMTAGIFASHGVWVGSHTPENVHNPRGDFENTKIKANQKRITRQGARDGIVAEPVPGWRERVEEIIFSDGYEGGRWLFKFSAFNWRLWDEFDPWWIKCRRNPMAVFASCKRMGFPWEGVNDQERWKIILKGQEVLDEIPGVDVDTEAVVDGDMTTLKRAFDYCGIDFNEETARQFVMPGAWHYR